MNLAPELLSPSEWGWNRKPDGMKPGQHYQKHQKLVGNFCDVAARVFVLVTASVIRRRFDAQRFVSVVESALNDLASTENYCFCYCIIDNTSTYH